MITQLEARGGCQYLSLSVNHQLKGRKLLRVINATVGSLVVRLPKATIFDHLGWPAQVVINNGGFGANSFTLADFDGNTVATLAAAKIAVLGLVDKQTDAGQWVVRVNDVGKATA